MVFVPLGDNNPRIWIRYHYVTLSLIGLCGLAYIWLLSFDQEAVNRVAMGLGMIPSVVQCHTKSSRASRMAG